MNNLLSKLKEALVSVLPITLIVLALSLFAADIESGPIWNFLIGSVLVILGMGLFTLGADVAMVTIGNRLGASITKSKKLKTIVIFGFIIGLIITIAEPDLIVLAEQLSAAIDSYALIVSVGVGVGLFLVGALLRIVFQIPLRRLLFILYIIVFTVAAFVPEEFLAVAFDSGGVTTGAMTVPFIMALGMGVASTMGKGEGDDNFGLIALCSVGPILAVMLLGIFSKGGSLTHESFVGGYAVSDNLIGGYIEVIPKYLKEVALALAPIAIFFYIYNFAVLKLPPKVLIRITFGLLYVYLGLLIFLIGVNVGFSPVGNMLGAELVNEGRKWLLIPIGMVIGFFIVAAEPAVHVLIEQVEEISEGKVKKRKILLALMFGVGAAIGLSMLRVISGLSIWWLILPGYAVALIMSLVTPKMFSAIAFDSGGVASGPMTATFLLPFAIGAAMAAGSNVLTDAFGVVAMVAMAPLITIQLMGLLSVYKAKKASVGFVAPGYPLIIRGESAVDLDDEVVDLG